MCPQSGPCGDRDDTASDAGGGTDPRARARSTRGPSTTTRGGGGGGGGGGKESKEGGGLEEEGLERCEEGSMGSVVSVVGDAVEMRESTVTTLNAVV